VRRRNFLAGAGALLAAPSVFGQPRAARVFRIGGLSAAVPRESPLWRAVDKRLAELGYVEGRNLAFEFRNASGRFEDLPALARDLIATRPDVIMVTGPEASIRAAKQAAGSVPVVMVAIDVDPVAAGLVRSLQRPGTNMTGLSAQQIDLTVKRLQLLKEMLPALRRVTVLANATTGTQLAAVTRASGEIGVELDVVELGDPPHDYDALFKAARQARADGMFVLSSGIFFRDRVRITQAALEHALPAAYSQGDFADYGGLLAYGVDLPQLYRRAAEYMDRILKGASPSELPVEQATKFELVINAKTARALKIAVPQSLLVRADRVVE
jgi:putative tryptophan/tyrosine transport system substrate-binding protein